MRKSGVLLPVSSIPSKYGIGTFSKQAYAFIDLLEKAGQSYWQILPLGPTGYGDSPYQSFSTFAGNPYYIDLEALIEEGYLTKADCDQYDFGDNWCFNIVLEKIFQDANINGRDLPRVIEGEGFGIIEDCGGTMELEDIREAFKIKKGEDYEMYSNWLSKEELDLEKCDLDDLNFRLKKLPRIFKDSYEYGLEPTERSIKILEREYK